MRSRLSQLSSPLWKGLDFFDTQEDLKELTPFYRSFSLSNTIRNVLKKRLPLGITRLNYLTPLNRVEIPVYSITRPNVHSCQITTTQGKGFFIREALASGLMETVERDAAGWYRNLTRHCEKDLQTSGKAYLPLEAIGYSYSEEELVDWVPSLNLKNGHTVLIPACEVLFPYTFPKDSVKINHPSTTGISSGNTHLEAIIYGIFEVVERHAVSEFLCDKPFQILDISSIHSETILTLFDRLEKLGAEWCIFDLSSLAGFPCFFVSLLYLDAHTPPVMVAGQGCHLSPVTALKRALSEAIQSHTVAIQGNREDLIRHQGEWENNEQEIIDSWHQTKKAAEAFGFSRLPTTTERYDNMYDFCHVVCDKVESQGYQNMLITDLTSPRINIPVVHVLIPGMVDHTSNEDQVMRSPPSLIY